jgi:uncharacterized membrane protein YdjX (TVP38/TMEM64 family)
MRSPRLRVGLLIAVLVGASVWLTVAGGPSGGELKRTVHDAGWLAPVAFVAIYIGWTVLLLPGVVPTLAGGALFGVVFGSLLTLIGATVGATLAFVIARSVARTPVKQLAGRRGAQVEQWLARHGFVALLYARLVPIVPFNALNYAAGFAGISARRYVVATAIGIVPGTVAYTALGSTAAHPGSVPFLVSLGAVVVLTLIVGVLSRLRRRALAAR